MKIFKTKNILKITGGLIGLSDDQAKARANMLEDVGKGVYRIMQKVEFKAGEAIGLEKPDKHTLASLTSVKPVKK